MILVGNEDKINLDLLPTGRYQSHWKLTIRSLVEQEEMEQWPTADYTTPSKTNGRQEQSHSWSCET